MATGIPQSLDAAETGDPSKLPAGAAPLPASPASTEESVPLTPEERQTRLAEAKAIVTRHVLWSLGAGVLPIPLVDLVAVTGVQLKMIAELTKLYGIEFRQGVASKLVYSLLSSIGGVGVGTILGSLAKSIPVLGTTLGVAATPVLAGAATQAIGSVFVMNFELGGNLVGFDIDAARAHVEKEYEKAKVAVSKLAKNS